MKITINVAGDKIDLTINKSQKKVTAKTYWNTGEPYAKWQCEGYPQDFEKNTLIFFWLDCNIYKIKQY